MKENLSFLTLSESSELLSDWTSLSHKPTPEPIIVGKEDSIFHPNSFIAPEQDAVKITNIPTLVTTPR